MVNSLVNFLIIIARALLFSNDNYRDIHIITALTKSMNFIHLKFIVSCSFIASSFHILQVHAYVPKSYDVFVSYRQLEHYDRLQDLHLENCQYVIFQLKLPISLHLVNQLVCPCSYCLSRSVHFSL